MTFKMRLNAAVILIVALCVSVGFGLLKQVKGIVRSLDALKRPAVDAGDDYRIYRDYLLRRHGAAARNLVIVYETDRVLDFSYRGLPSVKPGQEYFYDFQYALAPILLNVRRSHTDYFLMDFTSEESLEVRLKTENRVPLVRVGSSALAKPKQEVGDAEPRIRVRRRQA